MGALPGLLLVLLYSATSIQASNPGEIAMSEASSEAVHSACILRSSRDGEAIVLVSTEAGLRVCVEHGDGLGTRLPLGAPEELIGPSGEPLLEGGVEGFAAVVGADESIHLFWSQGGRTWTSRGEVRGDGANRVSWAEPEGVCEGVVTSASVDARGEPYVAGWAEAGDGRALWCARRDGGRWEGHVAAEDAHYEAPRVAVSEKGVVHLVWRDTHGLLWHASSVDGRSWVRGEGTVSRPERIGYSPDAPAVVCSGEETIVAYVARNGQIQYSHLAAESWECRLSLTAGDSRFEGDQWSAPTFGTAGDGVPWLFFVDRTRRFCYYTRWLGSDFSTMTVARRLFRRTEDWSSYLAPIEAIAVEGRAWRGSASLGLVLVNNKLPERLRAEALTTPVLVGRPGEEHLFLDDLELVRSHGVELYMPGPVKHPNNPILTHGPEGAFDSHRVFNSGEVVLDGQTFRMWYGALNTDDPEAFWEDWTKTPRTGYAESPDGIHWTKPILNLAQWRGSAENNMVPGFGIVPFVMLNPDQSDPKQKFLAFNTGSRFYSPDGWVWTRDEDFSVSFPGGRPQWFSVNLGNVLYDPEEPDPRLRWKAYGCFAPKDPQRAIGLSYSPDGHHWTVYAENPIVSPLSGPHPMLHDLSISRWGSYYMMVCQAGLGSRMPLYLMGSRDGINWWPICETEPFIRPGEEDAWDRGFLLPSQPLVMGDEVWLYYGGADFGAVSDPHYDRERTVTMHIACGLARLPLNRWAGFRTTAGDGRSIGYIETGPIRAEDIRDCVLSVNVDGCDADHYLLAEILHGETDERVPGYEQENSDETHESGLAQVMSWRGGASLNGIPRGAAIRIRFVLHGAGSPVLYSWSFRRDGSAGLAETPPDRPGRQE